MENLFWFDPQDEHGGDSATWGNSPMEPSSKTVSTIIWAAPSTGPHWSNPEKSKTVRTRSGSKGSIGRKSRALRLGENQCWITNRGIPTVWSAGFSHRWSIRRMKPISSKINPGSGLPEYLLLDHKNDPVGGGISVRLSSITEPSILRAKPSTSYTLTLSALLPEIGPRLPQQSGNDHCRGTQSRKRDRFGNRLDRRLQSG